MRNHMLGLYGDPSQVLVGTPPGTYVSQRDAVNLVIGVIVGVIISKVF